MVLEVNEGPPALDVHPQGHLAGESPALAIELVADVDGGDSRNAQQAAAMEAESADEIVPLLGVLRRYGVTLLPWWLVLARDTALLGTSFPRRLYALRERLVL